MNRVAGVCGVALPWSGVLPTLRSAAQPPVRAAADGADALDAGARLRAGGADRYPREQVLRAAEWANAVLHIVIGVLLLSGHAPVWGLVTLTFLAGTAGALVWPAMTGIVPQVVPAHSLQDGNALIGIGGNTARVAGLVAGGIVVAIGGGWALIAAGVIFAVAGLCVGRLRLTRPPQDDVPGLGMLRELRVGWSEFRSRTWLWVCVLQFWRSGRSASSSPVRRRMPLGHNGFCSCVRL